MKQMADKKRCDVEFQEGDMVYLKLQPYRQSTVFRRANQKLTNKFFGPYKILHKFGSVAYKLQLPPESQVHQVFHVSLLKKAIG